MGAHTVVATVTDTQGVSDTDNVTFTVQAPMVVTDITVDDQHTADIETSGSWSESGASGEYDGHSQFNQNENGWFKWKPPVVTAGEYKVSIWYAYHANRSPNAVYTIHHANGDSPHTVVQNDQSQGGQFNELPGTYYFNTGSSGYVQLTSTTGGNSFSADAVKLVYVGPGTPPANQSPQFTNLTNQSSPVNVAIPPVTLTATDPENDTPLTFSHVSGLPAGLSLAADGTITGTPTVVGGPNTVTVKVTDSQSNMTDDTFEWEVTSGTSDIIVDDQDTASIAKVGSWTPSGASNEHAGESLYSQGEVGSFKWIPTIATAGEYDVYVWWTVNSNRSPAAPYKVNHAGGLSAAKEFAQNDPASANQWHLIDRYSFNAGTDGYVILNSTNTGKSFSADAIKLVYVGPANTEVPTVEITNPTVGNTTFDAGETITFTGTASDIQDTAMSGADLTWKEGSNTLHIGSTFDKSDFSVGQHTITASVTDSDSNATAKGITITVEAPGPVTVTVDNDDTNNTTKSGTWGQSGAPSYYGQDSRFSQNENGWFRWSPPVTEAGTYKVLVWYTSNSNRSPAAEYTIDYDGGQDTKTQAQNTGGGAWVELGQYAFAVGNTGYIEIKSVDDGRSYCADAVRLEKVQ